MNEKAGTREDEVIDWARQKLGVAVKHLLQTGVFDDDLVEAKPAWTLPHSVVIGKVRQQGESKEFLWVICSEAAFDYIRSSLAATPREAARHFAMKWQLEAERQRDPAVRKKLDPEASQDWDVLCGELVNRAESLSELVSVDGLWSSPPVQG